MRLGIVSFIVPFILIYDLALILIGTPMEIILAVITAIIGVCAFSIGLEGYFIYPYELASEDFDSWRWASHDVTWLAK